MSQKSCRSCILGLVAFSLRAEFRCTGDPDSRSGAAPGSQDPRSVGLDTALLWFWFLLLSRTQRLRPQGLPCSRVSRKLVKRSVLGPWNLHVNPGSPVILCACCLSQLRLLHNNSYRLGALSRYSHVSQFQRPEVPDQGSCRLVPWLERAASGCVLLWLRGRALVSPPALIRVLMP